MLLYDNDVDDSFTVDHDREIKLLRCRGLGGPHTDAGTPFLSAVATVSWPH